MSTYTAPRSLYRYACECGNKDCGETMAVPREAWLYLAGKGAVVHVGCLGSRRALAAWGEARAVRTTMIGGC